MLFSVSGVCKHGVQQRARIKAKNSKFCKQEENVAKCIDLFNYKEKTTDKCVYTQSSFGNVAWNCCNKQVQAFLPSTGKKQRLV